MQSILVLGGGSAGLIAALTLKRKIPRLTIRVVRSPEIGVIGVGESTTPNIPVHLFEYLGLSRKRFYDLAEPTWKLGIRFLWGPRESFNYSFQPQVDIRLAELPRPMGYYFDQDFTNSNLQSALMLADKAFALSAKGVGPEMTPNHAFHLENVKLVKALEAFAAECGVEIIDGNVDSSEPGPAGIAAVTLTDGRRLTADFFIDASGFRSELLGKALREPFVSFGASLFNDRAIVGRWDRTDEPILPYTTAETMNAGWCWRVEHEHHINRGYVFSSSFISDEEARHEFQQKNPRATVSDRLVKFRTGRYERCWVGNVMAIGNASGFVEPLESTSLMVVCWQSQVFTEFLSYLDTTDGVRTLFNRKWAETWNEIRDFLALHFWGNRRLDTPYWKHCCQNTDISSLKPLLDFYQENGPTGYNRYNLKSTGSQFGIEGFLSMLVGMQVPYRSRHSPSPAEWSLVDRRRAAFKAKAQTGLDVKQALEFVRHPAWRWFGES